jgi:hypothetical protein
MVFGSQAFGVRTRRRWASLWGVKTTRTRALVCVAVFVFVFSAWQANRQACPGCTSSDITLVLPDGTPIHARLYLPPQSRVDELPGSALVGLGHAPADSARESSARRSAGGFRRFPAVVVCPGYLANLGFMEIPWAADITRLGAAALVVDRRGQGRSGGALWPRGPQSAQLREMEPDIAAGIVYLRAQTMIDPTRIAILGHSDGATAAIAAAAADWDIRATIAISASVAPSGFVNHVAPRNLLLVYGEGDHFVLDNTDADLVWRATRGYLAGPGSLGDIQAGDGRSLIRVPGHGHVDVLYSAAAREAILKWIGESLSLSGPAAASSSRMTWVWLGLLGLFAAAASGPLLWARAGGRPRRHTPVEGRPTWLIAVVVVGWIGGLLLAHRLRGTLGVLVPASEGATFFAVLAGPLLVLSGARMMCWVVSPNVGRPRRSCEAGRRYIVTRASETSQGVALAAIVYGAIWVLVLHHYELYLGAQRPLLLLIVSSVGVPAFLTLDAWLSLTAGSRSYRAALCLCVMAIATAACARLMFERMSVLPGYLLALVLLLFATLRLSLGARRRVVAIGCGVTMGWLAAVVCTLY